MGKNIRASAKVFLLSILLIGATGLGYADPEPLLLSISPTFQHGPIPGHPKKTVKYKITVEPHRDNAILCFGWENHRFVVYRSSCIELHGTRSPRTFWQEYQVDIGSHTGFAQLIRVPFRVAARQAKPFHVLDP